MGDNVVAKVRMGVITSEFFGQSNSSIANKFADEPEFTIIPSSLPNKSETFFSKSFTLSPIIVL